MDGRVVLSEADDAATEKAMAQRLLAENGPVSVIMLGEARYLLDQFDGQTVEYRRIVLKRVEEVMAERKPSILSGRHSGESSF